VSGKLRSRWELLRARVANFRGRQFGLVGGPVEGERVEGVQQGSRLSREGHPKSSVAEEFAPATGAAGRHGVVRLRSAFASLRSWAATLSCAPGWPEERSKRLRR